MGNNINPTYVFLKGNTYYFNRHIPKDIRSYYKSNRVIICLKTKQRFKALRAAKSIAQRLEDYWVSLRMSKIVVISTASTSLYWDRFFINLKIYNKYHGKYFLILYLIA